MKKTAGFLILLLCLLCALLLSAQSVSLALPTSTTTTSSPFVSSTTWRKSWFSPRRSGLIGFGWGRLAPPNQEQPAKSPSQLKQQQLLHATAGHKNV